MIEDILQNCRPQTKLCIAANITCEGEFIQTRTVKDWKGHIPNCLRFPVFFSYTNNIFQVFVFIFEATAEKAFAIFSSICLKLHSLLFLKRGVQRIESSLISTMKR